MLKFAKANKIGHHMTYRRSISWEEMSCPEYKIEVDSDQIHAGYNTLGTTLEHCWNILWAATRDMSLLNFRLTLLTVLLVDTYLCYRFLGSPALAPVFKLWTSYVWKMFLSILVVNRSVQPTACTKVAPKPAVFTFSHLDTVCDSFPGDAYDIPSVS